MGLIDYGKSVVFNTPRLRVELDKAKDDQLEAVKCMKSNISRTMDLVMQRSITTYNGLLDKQSNSCT